MSNTLHKWLPLIAAERRGLVLTSITQVIEMLGKEKPSARIIFFDWRNGEISFPARLMIMDPKDYEITVHHPLFSSRNICSEIKRGQKLISFDVDGQSTYKQIYVDDKRKFRGDMMPLGYTAKSFAADLKKIKGYFLLPREGGWISPQHVAHFNIETYKIGRPSRKQVMGMRMKDGDVLCFGLGSTMSTEWGDFKLSLEKKK